MSWAEDFPRLNEKNHRFTSSATVDYNCIAWAAEDIERWWQPGAFWPIADWPKSDCGLGALEHAMMSLGYANCGLDTSLEPGFTKVAIYGWGSTYTHAARQLPNGKWTSKLGKGEDIEHDSPDDVTGGLYGELAEIMKKPTTR